MDACGSLWSLRKVILFIYFIVNMQESWDDGCMVHAVSISTIDPQNGPQLCRREDQLSGIDDVIKPN